MQETIVITIGSNLNSRYMGSEKWNFFKKEVTTVFDKIFFFGEGTGNFKGEVETSFIISGTSKKSKEEVEEIILNLVLKYEQESIAVIYGTSVLLPRDNKCI